MKSNWTIKKLSDIAEFNPKERLPKGTVAKKIAMDKLQPFCRDVPEYENVAFTGGTKFRNGDTIMARITPCLENGKTAKVAILGFTFKENCPDTRNSKVVDIINRLKEYDITPVVTDAWADKIVAKHEYGVNLVAWEDIPKADCVIVAVGHNKFRSMSMMQLKTLFKEDLPDEEKVLIDVKSLYRMDELKASGMRFWRL